MSIRRAFAVAVLALVSVACTAGAEGEGHEIVESLNGKGDGHNSGGDRIDGELIPRCTDTEECFAETAEVLEAFDNDVVGRFSSGEGFEFSYCRQGLPECRSLLLQNVDGVPAAFVDNFASSRRFVASSGYFLPNEDGTFRIYLDQSWDATVNVDLVWEENQAITVTFDNQGLPTMHNMVFKQLGTTRYAVATLTHRQHEATIIGTLYDETDPSFANPLEIRYRRVNR